VRDGAQRDGPAVAFVYRPVDDPEVGVKYTVTGCLLPERTYKRNTPGDKPGVLRTGRFLVSVAVMVTGVLVLRWYNLDNCGLSSALYQGHRPSVGAR
jgi:hypothetical protein